MFEKFLSATLAWLVAALSVGLASAADPVPGAEQKQPPRIVASPATVVEQPKPGVPVPCDVGKFIFLELTGYRGDVSWDFSVSGIVALLPDAPAGATAEYYPGIKQGESAPVWHKLPSKTSVPCLGVKEGTVTISAWVVVENRAKKAAEITVQVGNGPRPPPDVEPDVKPPVSTNPFGETKGLHVMMVYADNSPLPTGQHNAIYGAKVREYLNTKCETPQSYRIWPASVDSSGDLKLWGDAFARKRDSLPWIIIGNGKSGYEGPLPATVDETLALLKKYGDK